MPATPPALPSAADNTPLAPVKRLVLHKRAIERAIHTGPDQPRHRRLAALAGGLGPRLGRAEAVALDPAHFLHACIGFMGSQTDYDQAATQLVSPWRVLGGRYQDYRDSPYSHAWVMQRTADFAGEYRQGRGRHLELISLTHVPALGLYLAVEGKNRISLFQRYHRPLPAVVESCIDIPPARALRLIRCRPYGVWQLEYTRDGRRHPIPFPASIVPLLRSYGVGEHTRVDASPATVWDVWRVRRTATCPDAQMRP